MNPQAKALAEILVNNLGSKLTVELINGIVMGFNQVTAKQEEQSQQASNATETK